MENCVTNAASTSKAKILMARVWLRVTLVTRNLRESRYHYDQTDVYSYPIFSFCIQYWLRPWFLAVVLANQDVVTNNVIAWLSSATLIFFFCNSKIETH